MQYVSQSPNSPFHQMRFLSKVTDTGRVILSGNSLTEVTPFGKQKREAPEEEISQVVQQMFGISME